MSFPKNKILLASIGIFALIILALFFEDDDYFPLDEGYTWHYRITITSDNPTEFYKSVRVSLDETTFYPEGAPHALTLTPIKHENNLIYYYYKDGDGGLYRLAHQKRPSGALNFEKDPRLVHPPLDDISSDDEWVVSDKTYLLVREKPLYAERATLIIPLTYRIESRVARVRVAAGIFTDCLHIIGTGTTSFLSPRTPEGGKRTQVEVISEEFYAPNIGLVKMVRQENTRSELFGDNRLTKELESFEKPLW